jgi:hypothetical protein
MAPSSFTESFDSSELLKPIERHGTIYMPTNSVRELRENRSKVSKYNDEDLRDMDEFRYDRLPSMRRRIRLLRLLGGGLVNPEISCELFEVEYDKKNVVRKARLGNDLSQRQQYDRPPDKGGQSTNGEQSEVVDPIHHQDLIEYEALSWCWGMDSKDCGIRIKKDGEQYRLPVTRELALALKYLRRPREDRILWIDALCINQADHEERNHQVQMMALIYNCATQVCVWLGEDNDDSATAIRFIREIMALENFDSISEKKENASKWQSLLLLMQRPWFSRRWVVQEIALARAATIYCGVDRTSYSTATSMY